MQEAWERCAREGVMHTRTHARNGSRVDTHRLCVRRSSRSWTQSDIEIVIGPSSDHSY